MKHKLMLPSKRTAEHGKICSYECYAIKFKPETKLSLPVVMIQLESENSFSY